MIYVGSHGQLFDRGQTRGTVELMFVNTYILPKSMCYAKACNFLDLFMTWSIFVLD